MYIKRNLRAKYRTLMSSAWISKVLKPQRFKPNGSDWIPPLRAVPFSIIYYSGISFIDPFPARSKSRLLTSLRFKLNIYFIRWTLAVTKPLLDIPCASGSPFPFRHYPSGISQPLAEHLFFLIGRLLASCEIIIHRIKNELEAH